MNGYAIAYLSCAVLFAAGPDAENLAESLAENLNEALWEAAKQGEAEKVEALLDQGVDVNAKTRYAATALSFAAQRGHLDVVELLLESGADVNVEDTFYKSTPVGWAAGNGHLEIVTALLDAGAQPPDGLLLSAVIGGKEDLTRLLLEKARFDAATLDKAVTRVEPEHEAIREMLEEAGGKSLITYPIDAAVLQMLAGSYTNEDATEYEIRVDHQKLIVTSGGRRRATLVATGERTFQSLGKDVTTYSFEGEGQTVTGFVLETDEASTPWRRIEPRADAMPVTSGKIEDGPVEIERPRNWPSFRGNRASGVADGQFPPSTWNAETGENVLWKTFIAGLGHSSPVVWQDKIFLTTAVSGDPEARVKPGRYGDVSSVEDPTVHSWCVYCIDKNDGRILWQQMAHRGVPKIKRHPKGTHANPTAATDGDCVVVSFGSEGLYCYTTDGCLRWKNDLGLLDAGWFYDSAFEWGFASSPVIFRDLAIVQCDTGKESFIAAFNLADGTEAWRTARDEIPSWGTPTIYEDDSRAELITNGTNYARGYDPATGEELWRLGPNSEITVPTPIVAGGLILVSSGYRAPRPIYAVRPGARGDISLADGAASSQEIAWSNDRAGTYMPSPIAYDEHLYTCSNSGILSCYRLETGDQVYRQRLPGGFFSASPVAADGRLYFTAEEGDVYVVAAGPEYELLAVNPVADVCLATPAISDGMIILRSERFLFGIGRHPR